LAKESELQGKYQVSGIRLWLRSRNYKGTMRANHAAYTTFVLSYPKCGRTWHRALVGFYLTSLLNEDSKRALDLPYLCSRTGIRPILYTHNGSNPTDHLPLSSRLVASPIEWQDRDVLLLIRDPYDAIVSAYHHVKHRERQFQGTISEFIETEAYGIDKYLTALSRWLDNRHLARKFMMISYEQIHRDTIGTLRDTLRFAGLAQIDDKLAADAVAACAFDRMKEYEANDLFSSEILRNSSGKPEAAKVRRGQVGAARAELAPDDRQKIHKAVERYGLANIFETLE
jgi:hypothetical protein